ncbi:GNAT family N-acetyltransferase [Nesterenkonia sp. E16_7]|uniref:GNAT family N-acetyltransferase n=1 Tax=unclassified Nesterenkonia TaxID=2629769 RepID=UPI001A92F838|nr:MULTISPECIES: GNAT family N-acetyltransferase [unclassified Nesterenkonia]MBO0596935.1 GNAT family N-acetyltransferase [Nesterenkonia sp. E16_10]MBO0598111.1 GNAT family N-acetyltransferase [Nesterenkonia sp. E16_7]
MTGPQAQGRAAPAPSPVVIRGPRCEDAERIAALHVATWKETYLDLLPEGFFTEGHSRQRREMWTQLLGESRNEWRIRLAESDGEFVGFAMAGPAQEQAQSAASPARSLYMLYVLRSHHGIGAGQALLDATLGPGPGSDSEPGPGSGSEPVSLWVAKQNPRAIAFYLRNGFRFDGAEKQDPGAPAITDARMVRP